jgi:hypothetical protein
MPYAPKWEKQEIRERGVDGNCAISVTLAPSCHKNVKMKKINELIQLQKR